MTSSGLSHSTALVTGAIRQALLLPLNPGSTVVALSSGATVAGSPLSGGYAGAKAAIRLITGYAEDESGRAGLGIRFISMLPKLTSATELGSMAVEAYPRHDGLTVDEYIDHFGPGVTPRQVGEATVELAASSDYPAGAYLLSTTGLAPAP